MTEEHICEFCDVEFTIETEDDDMIAFCPYCGADITIEDDDLDWEMDED